MDADTLLVTLGVINLALSAIVAWAASQKGRSAVLWFLLSLLFTPLFAVLVLIVVGARNPPSAAAVDLPGHGTGPAATSVVDGNVRAWKRQQQLDRIRPKEPPQ